MKQLDIIEFKFHVNKSNINLMVDICNSKWRIKWRDNIITAQTFYAHTSNPKKFTDIFDRASNITPIDIGNLLDLLTFCSDLTVDTGYSYRLYPIENNQVKGLSFENVKLGVSKESGDALDIFPKRIDDSSYDEKNNELTLGLIEQFKTKKFNQKELKLLNYWRKGFDLEEFSFFEESFLNFYKIIEYFIKSSKVTEIPQKYLKCSDAYKCIGEIIKDIKEDNIRLISDFIEIRHNFDVAHSKISKLPPNRAMGFYFSYVEGLWDIHDHIKQVTRLLLLKYMGINGYMLKEDGGILHLQKTVLE